MLKILGEHYYLDLDEIEEYINIPQTTATTENHISIVKYEIVKVLMDTILTENEPVDETLGIKSSGNMTISFKVAFNTLLNKKLDSFSSVARKIKLYFADEELEGEDPCWDGYEQYGTKTDESGKEVPNCIPIKD
jgi:hypothetical protein